MKGNSSLTVSASFKSTSPLLEQPHKCEYGPDTRYVYVLTYITKGKGYYEVAGKKYSLKKGDSFLVYPGTVIHYYPDEEGWEYMWVDFSGEEASEILSHTAFSTKSPTVSAAKGSIYKYFNDLCICHENMPEISTQSFCYLRKSAFYKLISEYIRIYPNQTENNSLLKNRITEYIYEKFTDPTFTVTNIEETFAMTHVALYKYFKENFNTTPKKFVNDLRISKAAALLNAKGSQIKNVALSSGFKDPLYFSKVFKKEKGFSPSEYFEEYVMKNLPFKKD